LDVLALLALAVMIAWLWPRTVAPSDLNLGHLPWWGSTRDVLLEGPDAGEWARNIGLLANWHLDGLDHHRMPGWMLMVAAAMEIEPDVVLAGHLANRALYALIGLTTYTLGRLSGGRVTGLLAAALALSVPQIMVASQRFGVDISITAMIPTLMALTVLATRRSWLGLAAGLAAGLTAGLHYTTPPFLLPPLLVLILSGGGRPWRRVAALVLYLAGASLAVGLLLQIYPVPSWAVFVNDIANGMSPHAGGPTPEKATEVSHALAGVQAQIVPLMRQATANAVDLVRIRAVPWPLMVALPWLGVLGLGLGEPRTGTGSWWRSLLSSTDLGAGLGLLACLAPLPVLLGVHAPERYGDNLLPVVAVLAARGAGSLVATVEALARVALHRWPRGPLRALVLAPLALVALHDKADLRTLPPPSASDLGARLLADALRDRFPPGTGVASPIREALVLAGLSYCPQTVCPTQATEDHFRRCMKVLASQCKGDGLVGYVSTSATSFYDPNARRLEMDAWVAAQAEPTVTVDFRDFHARVYELERPYLAPGEDPLAGMPPPGARADGSVPPPPR